MIITLNKYHRQRLIYIILLAVGLGLATTLILLALKKNINVFLTPSEIKHTQLKVNYPIRLGGMVKKNSVHHASNTLSVNFVVTDFNNEIPVRYQGILPDLFREGKGVIAEGTLNSKGVFIAKMVLAKHDENYMPKSIYRKLNEKSV